MVRNMKRPYTELIKEKSDKEKNDSGRKPSKENLKVTKNKYYQKVTTSPYKRRGDQFWSRTGRATNFGEKAGRASFLVFRFCLHFKSILELKLFL